MAQVRRPIPHTGNRIPSSSLSWYRSVIRSIAGLTARNGAFGNLEPVASCFQRGRLKDRIETFGRVAFQFVKSAVLCSVCAGQG